MGTSIFQGKINWNKTRLGLTMGSEIMALKDDELVFTVPLGQFPILKKRPVVPNNNRVATTITIT